MSSISRKMLMAAAGVDTDPTADYNKVSALYHFDGTNGLSNAGFAKDGGTYSGSFSISAGAPYQSEANPFSRPDGCWSVLFDGSDDYITTSDANLALGTGDFTIECWVYFSTTTVAEGLFQLSNGTLNSQVRGPAAGLDGSTGRWGMYHGTTYLVHGSEQPKVGDWYHVAFVRNSSTSKLYVNGVEKLSASDSTDYTDTNWTIGGWYSSSYLFTGYMSNFRIVKGTAVYTSAFTPPTSPLSAITNTQVLACQSHNFKENSGNSYTLTRASLPKIETNAPFNSTTVYDPATYGGSVDFDGSADYFSGSSAQSVGSDWTIDFWFYPRAAGSYSAIIGTADTVSYATQAQYMLHMNSGSLVLFRGTGGSYYDTTIGTPERYAWNHVAVSRSASATQGWMNGTRTLNSGTVTQPASSAYLLFGRFYSNYASYYYDGKLANFRMVDNSSIYSGATITVPTAPTTAVTDTLLLMNFNDLGLVDSLARKDSEALGNTQLSTAQKKFGTSSALFDGSGDYILLRDLAAPRGYASWTIECWIYIAAHKNYNFYYSAGTNIQLGVGADGRLGAWLANGVDGYFVNNLASTGDALSTTTWYHVALVRDYSAGTVTWFIDGTASGQATSVTAIIDYDGTTHSLGAYKDGTLPFHGYIDEFRITDGQAVYTEDFTAPTAAFPNS
mgnify:FL=1